MRVRTILTASAAAMAGMLLGQGRGNTTAWPTAYGDAQHSSWIRSDANISIETMAQPGFELQWKTTLESPSRQGTSLTSGVVASGINLFTPVSALAGASNQVFALDNDTGNLFWSRRFEGALPAATAACAGGMSGAPTRIASLVVAAPAAGRGRGGRAGGRGYSGAVGEPGAGVPLPPRGGGGGGGGGRRAGGAPETAARGGGAPAPAPTPAPPAPPAAAPPSPASPFPTNEAAVAQAGGPRGNLFRTSGVVHAVSADGMFRSLGFVSGKDVARPAPFIPAGANFSDLIGVGEMVYTATNQGCGGAPNAIWAINTSGDPSSVVSWNTNGGSPIGSPAFATNGTAIAAVGPGTVTTGGHANAIVALDPNTLAVQDWFSQTGVELMSPPVIFDDDGRNIVAVTTRDVRLLLLDAASLGGSNHTTPLLSVPAITDIPLTTQAPATWVEPGGTRWLLIPASGALVAVKIVRQNGAHAVQPGWISERISAPLTPIVINGVIFAASGGENAPATLHALDGTTGKTLWHSASTMTSPLSGRSLWAGSGHVFVGTRDGTVYAFGFAMERGAPSQRPGS